MNSGFIFLTATVGRSQQSDIVVEHETVSRAHVECTLTVDGRLYVIDKCSTHGTYQWLDNSWQPIRQCFAPQNGYIALGKKKLKIANLIADIKALGWEMVNGPDPISVRPKRNALTGEVII